MVRENSRIAREPVETVGYTDTDVLQSYWEVFFYTKCSLCILIAISNVHCLLFIGPPHAERGTRPLVSRARCGSRAVHREVSQRGALLPDEDDCESATEVTEDTVGRTRGGNLPTNSLNDNLVLC